MAVLVKIISDNAVWIYLACLLAALWLLRSALLARRERQQAAFKLEREAALNRTHSALRWAVLVLAVMGLTYFVANTLSVAVEPIIAEADPTPTPVFLLDTPTPTAEPTLDATATATPTPRPRATPRPVEPTPTAVVTPTTPPILAPSCPDGRAIILEPGVGQRVTGPVTLIGTAQSENFEYFKIEFKPAGASGDFSFYLRRDAPVINGSLGTWNPAGLPPGAYELRLVTVDVTGNFGQCSVQVSVGG